MSWQAGVGRLQNPGAMATGLEDRARAALGPEPSTSRAACIPRISHSRRHQVRIEGPAEGPGRGLADRASRPEITFTHPTRQEAVTIVRRCRQIGPGLRPDRGTGLQLQYASGTTQVTTIAAIERQANGLPGNASSTGGRLRSVC